MAGVPQGSFLILIMCNILYDEVLYLQLPKDCDNIAFANDLALIIRANNKDGLMNKANKPIAMVIE